MSRLACDSTGDPALVKDKDEKVSLWARDPILAGPKMANSYEVPVLSAWQQRAVQLALNPLDAPGRRLWGQVRPGGAHTVTVERRSNGGEWSTLAVTRTNARGYWALRRPLARGASYRYRADGRVSATLRP